MLTRLYQIAMVIVPFIATCFVVYLIGSFVSASFKPEEWELPTRIVCSLWGMAFGFGLWMKLEATNVL